jgi:cytochrome P450
MGTLATALPEVVGDPFAEAEMAAPGRFDAQVREAGDLVLLPEHGCLATGRHDVARAILRDWKAFTSTGGTGLRDIRRDPWRVPSIILDTDPPDHNRARAVLNDILSLKSLDAFRATVDVAADRLVRDLIARGRFDAATDLALALPLAVFPDAVGLTGEGREHLLLYAALNFNSLGPRNTVWHEAEEAARDSVAWVTEQCVRDRLAPGGFGAAIYAHADAGAITEAEAGLLVRTFLSAGLDTTIHGIGNAIRALAENPGEWTRLRADPSLAGAAFEESLRVAPPSHLIGRTVTRDCRFNGVDLTGGSKVLLFVAAANRDPRAFDAPDAFDIGRAGKGHLSFGIGVHGCVGQVVARIEAAAVLAALARHAATLELDGPPALKPANWLRGHASLPVRVTPG